MPSNTENKYAPTQWGGEVFNDVTMPSGQVAQLRRPGVQGLIAAGLLESLDSLSAIVGQDLIPTAQGKKAPSDRKPKKAKSPEIDIKTLMKKPEQLANIMHLVDRVTVHCVMQPKIEMAPNDITSRKEGVIYTDSIDLGDRMFIFNYAVGGTTDLQTFRAESEAALGDLGDQPEAALPAE